MKKWMTLFNLVLKDQFRLSVLRERYVVRKERLWEPALAILFFMMLIPAFIVIGAFYQAVYMGMQWAGHPEGFLILTVAGGQSVILMFGFFHGIGRLYFSKDSEALLALPVTPVQAFSSRMAGLWISEGLLLCLLTLPGFLVYGWSEDVGAGYYAKIAPALLLLPALPLSLAAILAMLFMRVTNLKRYRNLLRALGPFLGVMMGVGFQLFINSGRSDKLGEVKSAGAWLVGPGSLTETLTRYFPPVKWAADALGSPLFGAGGISWLLFLGVTLAAVGITVGVSGGMYYRGLIGGNEQRERGGHFRSVVDAALKKNPPFLALFRKEWRMLFRTPAFALQAVLGTLLFPVMMFLPTLWLHGDWQQNIDALNAIPFREEVLIWGGVAGVAFLTGVNGVAASSVSREGNLFALSKSLPVSAGVQVAAKWFLALVFTGFVTLLVTGMQWVVGGEGSVLIWTAFLGLSAGFLTTGLGVAINLLFPRLDWNTPQEAIRGGFNGLWLMLTQLVGGMLLAVVVWIFRMLSLPDYLIYSFILLVLVIANIGLFAGVRQFAEKRYRKIEC